MGRNLYPWVFKGKHSVPFWHVFSAYYKYLSWTKDCILVGWKFLWIIKMTLLSFLWSYILVLTRHSSTLKYSKYGQKLQYKKFPTLPLKHCLSYFKSYIYSKWHFIKVYEQKTDPSHFFPRFLFFFWKQIQY